VRQDTTVLARGLRLLRHARRARPLGASVLAIAAVVLATRQLMAQPPSPAPLTRPYIVGVATVSPWVALIAGILILIFPRILNYVVAIYLIIIGLIGIFGR
jgi:hypothetical protein